MRSVGFADFFGAAGAVRYGGITDDVRMRRMARGGYVTSGWFDSTGVNVVAGDGFRPADSRQDVGIVNQALVASTGESGRLIVGRQVTIAHPDGARPRTVRIVGVVSNLVTSVDGRDIPMIFLPMPQVPPPALVLTVRANSLDAAVSATRTAVNKADPDVPVTRVESVQSRYDDSFKVVRAITWFGLEMGLLALLLAVAGLYAVTAYSVRRRTREIGIRMALGATLGQILALVLRQGFAVAAGGVVIGLALAIPIAFALRSVLFGISAADPRALLATTGVLVAAGLAASAIPAYRAATIDPALTLHTD